MKISKENIQDFQTKYTVTIDGEDWKNCQEKGLAKITKNIQLPGFRKGKVPINMIKGKVSDEEIIKESASFATDIAYKYMLEKEKPEIFIQPILEIEDVDEKSATLNFVVQNMPEFDLKQYNKFTKIKEEPIKTDKKMVDEQVQKILESKVEFKEVNRASKNGDVLDINFEGFIDGKPFPGGKGQGTHLELGSKKFIKGFEEQLVKMKKDEEKEIVLDFPQDYHVKDLSGKKATFKCKINAVKEKVIPKLDDDFVKKQKYPNIKNVKELKEGVEKSLKDNAKLRSTRIYEQKLVDELLKVNKVPVPARILDLETNQLLKNFEEELKKQKTTIENFKKETGKTDEEIAKEFSQNALKRVTVTLIFEKIAKLEKIDLAKKEVEDELAKLAKLSKKPLEEIKKSFNMGQLAYNLRMKKIFDVVKK